MTNAFIPSSAPFLTSFHQCTSKSTTSTTFPHHHRRRYTPYHHSYPNDKQQQQSEPNVNQRRRTQPKAISAPEIAASSTEALQRLPLKRVIAWASLLITLILLRSFFPVIVGTFILSYVTNSVINAVGKRLPRRAVVGVFYAFIITAISGFSLMTIPTVVRESQYFISTLQSENPYVYAANSLRKALGDELTTKVETFVMYSTAVPGSAAKAIVPSTTTLSSTSSTLTKSPTSNQIQQQKEQLSSSSSSPLISDELDDEWTEGRSRRLGMLLQKSLKTYIAGTASLITKLIGASTKVVFKAILSLIFSFMIMWDLPVVTRGVQKLKRSRLSFMYEELSPIVIQFGSVLGKSFEAQGLIALVNTTLTTAGLIALSIPGVWFLCIATLLCSFIPVAGVFISTFPMCIIALSEFGVSKAMAVIFMVILVHIVEAYVLNPQIYSAHLHLHPLMVLAVLYIAEHSYGIPGLLLAVPVAVYILRTVMIDDGNSDSSGNDSGKSLEGNNSENNNGNTGADQMKLSGATGQG